MNKQELVAAIAKQMNIPKAQADKTLSTIVDIIKSALKKNDNVALIGFGTFGVKKRAARKGRNPATGEPIKIPAKKVPYFKPGKSLKEMIKGSKKK